MSSLRNIKNHVQAVRQNKGILATDQIQLVSTSSVPADANLANGRLYYLTGTGLRMYVNSTWYTIPTSVTGAAVTSWDEIYTADQNLNINATGTMTFAGVTALGAGDVITITAAAAVSGDCLQFTNSGTGSDVKGTSSTWSVSKAGASVFNSSVTTPAIVSYGAGADANLAIDEKGAGTIGIGATSTGAVTITPATTVTGALTATASITITGSADTTCLAVDLGDVTITAGLLSLDDDDTATGNLVIPSSTATTGNPISITADDLTDGAAIYVDSDNGASFTNDGGFIRLYNGAATVWAVGNDAATRILTTVNSTVGLTVSGIQTSANLALISSNGVTGNGVGTLKVTAAGATAAGSAVLLVRHTGTPAASTSYLAHFDYTGATEETNDPITVQISSGTSIGAALNITSTATTITGGILNITNAEMTSGVGINMTMAAIDTGQGILLTQATSVIADTGSLIRATSSGINTGGATNGTVLDLKTTGKLAGTMCRVDSIQTTGTVISVISTGIMTTTGNLLTLTANAATTAAGLLRVNANGLTSGSGVVITSSSTAITTGTLLTVNHSGNATTTALAPLSVFSSSAADNTTIIQIIDAADLAGGVALDISLAATTSGTGIDMGNFSAVTTGKGIFIDNDVATLTSGYLIHLDSASTAMTTGRLLLVDHTGNATATALCAVAEVKSAAADNTVVLQVLASAALAGGYILNVSGVAMTTGTGIAMSNLDALTSGIGLHIASAATAITGAGRLAYINHTGATGTSATLVEVASNASDETIIFKLTASGALAGGTVASIVADSATTGIGIDMTMDALTTGAAINIHSDSADITARDLVHVHNDNAAAVGTLPITLVQDAVVSAHFYKMIKLNSNSIWISDGTTPNAALAGTTGDICLNCDSNKPYYCTNGAGALWTALV